MGFLYSLFLKTLYPTCIAALLLMIGIIVRKRQQLSGAMAVGALGVLLTCGNGWLVEIMVEHLESQYPPSGDVALADCIVVLGGGTAARISPRLTVEVSEAGDRVVHAARLFRNGRAPYVLCSSGVATGGLALRAPSEEMADLVEFFGVPRDAILLESASGNTREHAKNLAPVFEEREFKRVLLVTSAMHMPRSMGVFMKYSPGVEFIAAPTDFRVVARISGSWHRQLGALLPTPSHLLLFSEAAHEYGGIAYYRLRGWM
jgi:uncharacterized SAM-binding protein YcdF (DUF218 family)